MNKFFPVGKRTLTAQTTTQAIAIPTGGPILRISRETSAAQVWINFGTSNVTADSDSMELVSGIVEELEIPNTAAYTYFAVICSVGTCRVNVCSGPRYDSK